MIPVMVNEVPIDCINQAAITYHVPAKVILAVLKQEAGHNGEASKNKNGSYDYGVMQINSIWLSKIGRYGYTREDIQYNACKNVMVGTWILSQNIAEGRNVWSGVGNYNSHTPNINQSYRAKIQTHYQKIDNVLET